MDSLFERSEKRKRSSNFHTQEIDTLLVLVKTDKRTIECKKTDQITNTYKDMAWKKIALTFNEKNLTKRSDKQLRSKWETLKKNARREYSADKLTKLSEKVLKILDLEDEGDLNVGIPLQLKEEPIFDDTMYEENENSTEMDQRIPVQLENHQECVGEEPVFQSNTSHSINSSKDDKPFEEESFQESQTSLATIMAQNVQWKPITIAQAFVSPSGILLPHHYPSQTDEEINSKIKKGRTCDNSISLGADGIGAMNTKTILSRLPSTTRGTQCDNIKSTQRKMGKRRSLCCHFFTGDHLKSLQKRLLIEENKRKKEKHQIEMDILRTELLIKKRQLEKLE